ncbi:MAG: hypothetical protein RIF41_27950 [Polyangiaceae bacterium]
MTTAAPHGHSSHHGVGRHARAGGAVDSLSVGGFSQVLKLHGLTDLAGAPGLLLVTLRYVSPTPLPPSGLAVVARVHWNTGKASFVAELDVPAGGAAIAVGGADGLEVELGVEATGAQGGAPVGPDGPDAPGADEPRLVHTRAEAIASWVDAAHPRPAQRTRWHAPGGLGEVVALPAFARAGRLLAPVPLSLTFHALPDAASPLATTLVTGPDVAVTVPVGAEGVSLVGPPSPASTPVASIWELCL